jgi:putative ABC transport system permease protein
MSDKPTPRDWMTIVGVVDDVAREGVAQARAQAVYQLLPQVDRPFFISHLNFVVRTDGPHGAMVAQAMRAAIREVDPEQPIESIMTMTSRLGTVIAEPRFRSLLLGVFTGIAMCLAAIGVYGVLAYSFQGSAESRVISVTVGCGSVGGGSVIFDSTGTALQHVAAAALDYERALASGVGPRMDMGK